MTKREDIDKRLVCTCNCGWVDKGDADARSTRPFVGAASLWKQVLDESGPRSKKQSELGHKVTYRQDMGKSVFGQVIRTGETRQYFVRLGLSNVDKEAVALAIFRQVSYAFEQYQGSRFLDSSFSAEDLVSNLLGFYGVLRPKLDLMSMCRPVSRAESLRIWDENGAVGKTKNKKWEPVFYECKECTGKPTFPKELQSIKPAPKGALFRDWTAADG
jgi:hypothetical protein